MNRLSSGECDVRSQKSEVCAESGGCSFREQRCLTREIAAKLEGAGLRPTRQRMVLARHLFGHGQRHLTAEMLHKEVVRSDSAVSLATVYNALQQFSNAGLLRPLVVDGQKTWFDTNTSHHHHMVSDHDGTILDVPAGYLRVERLPPVPEGMSIARVEVVVRLRRVAESTAE